MIPPGLEVRSELQVSSDTLAFGFSEARDGTSGTVWGEILDYIGKIAGESPTRFVVVDLRTVEYLSAAAVGHLTRLYRRLRPIRCELVLLISDPVVRGFFSAANLDKVFFVATHEAELHDLVKTGTLASRPPTSPSCPEAIEFSRDELTELDTTGVTLDDAIHTVERLRG